MWKERNVFIVQYPLGIVWSQGDLACVHDSFNQSEFEYNLLFKFYFHSVHIWEIFATHMWPKQMLSVWLEQLLSWKDVRWLASIFSVFRRMYLMSASFFYSHQLRFIFFNYLISENWFRIKKIHVNLFALVSYNNLIVFVSHFVIEQNCHMFNRQWKVRHNQTKSEFFIFYVLFFVAKLRECCVLTNTNYSCWIV